MHDHGRNAHSHAQSCRGNGAGLAGRKVNSTACGQRLTGPGSRRKVFQPSPVWLVLAGCLLLSPLLVTSSATASQGSDRITFAIDQTIKPARAQSPGLDRDAPPRPLASLIDPNGRQLDFVQNELVLVTDDPAALDAFAARWGAEVVKSVNPAEFGLPGARQHLLRIDTSRVNTASLAADLQAVAPPSSRVHHRVSSSEGLNLLAAAARESVNGLKVGVNWVGKSDGFIDRTTAESPNGPSAGQIPVCCPSEFGPGGYSPNAFNWTSRRDRDTA